MMRAISILAFVVGAAGLVWTFGSNRFVSRDVAALSRIGGVAGGHALYEGDNNTVYRDFYLMLHLRLHAASVFALISIFSILHPIYVYVGLVSARSIAGNVTNAELKGEESQASEDEGVTQLEAEAEADGAELPAYYSRLPGGDDLVDLNTHEGWSAMEKALGERGEGRLVRAPSFYCKDLKMYC